MAVHDTIGDMLTKIRNAGNAGKKSVKVGFSKLKNEIANILVKEGFINKVDLKGDKIKEIIVQLKYYEEKPVIEGIKRISTPGRRLYRGATEIPRFMNGLAVTIVSTSQGVITGKEAKEKNVGGELICYVW